MKDTKFAATLVIVGTATIVVAASVYYLTSSKKKVKNVLSRESFISNRNLSWFQLPPMGGETGMISFIVTEFVVVYRMVLIFQQLHSFIHFRLTYTLQL